MKWTQTQHSDRLNIARGLIHATVQWDILYSKGYKATVNSEEVDDHEQKAMDIGKDILSLIEEKTEEKVNEIGICRG